MAFGIYHSSNNAVWSHEVSLRVHGYPDIHRQRVSKPFFKARTRGCVQNEAPCPAEILEVVL